MPSTAVKTKAGECTSMSERLALSGPQQGYHELQCDQCQGSAMLFRGSVSHSSQIMMMVEAEVEGSGREVGDDREDGEEGSRGGSKLHQRFSSIIRVSVAFRA